MMSKYQGSKPIAVYSHNNSNTNNQQEQQQQIQKSVAVAQSSLTNTQQSKTSTIHNINGIEKNSSSNRSAIKQNDVTDDHRQTPRSDRKPEINIKSHKQRDQTKMKFETTNPFRDKENNDERKNLMMTLPLSSSPENQSPSHQQTQQQHYFTASFQNQNNNNTTTSGGHSCMPDCCTSGDNKNTYSNKHQNYNEHVCDEDCVHDDEDEVVADIMNNNQKDSKSPRKENTNASSPTSPNTNNKKRRYSSPSTSPHQITSNLRVTEKRDKSASKQIAINSLNAKLLTSKTNHNNHHHQVLQTSQTPNKSSSLLSTHNNPAYPNINNTTNNITNNMGMGAMGFHTTSSKQLNLSNNYTQSSMYVQPFQQNDSIHQQEYEDGDENTLLYGYGSIKNNNNSNVQTNTNSMGRELCNNNALLQNRSYLGNTNSVRQTVINQKSIERHTSNIASAHSSQNNSPNKGSSSKLKGNNIFHDKIEKIQKLQQKVINKTKRENESAKKQIQMNIQENQLSGKKSQSNTPRFEKTKLASRHEEINQQEEDLMDTSNDYVETDPINQLDHEIQNQPAGNYFSQLDQNYQNSQYHNNQTNPILLNSDCITEKLGFKFKTHLLNTTTTNVTGAAVGGAYLNNHSLYSTQSGFFNKQQDDQYLGTLNNFVDAKIQTLHVLIQEKRKLQLMLEEKQMTLKTVKQDKINQLKQEEIYRKEIALCEQRQHNLREQNKDLELQVHLVSEKIIEKSGEYQTQFGELEHQLGKEQRVYQDLEKVHELELQKQNDIKLQRVKEIDCLKDCNKEADEVLRELRGESDHKNTEEKNRVQFLRNKGNDVLKVIQDDKVYSERPNQKARDRSGNNIRSNNHNKTPNNKSNTSQIIDFNQQSTSTMIVKQEVGFRSTSQIGLRNIEKHHQISQQLQTYMQNKVNQHKNQNISCISINQLEDNSPQQQQQQRKHNFNNGNMSSGGFTNFSACQDNGSFNNKNITRFGNTFEKAARDRSQQNLMKERDQNITINQGNHNVNSSSRKESDQVLSSSKSSKDLSNNSKYHQPQSSIKVKEENKHQYFETTTATTTTKVIKNKHTTLQQSKSSVKISLLSQENFDNRQPETKIVQSTKQKSNTTQLHNKQQQGYQSSSNTTGNNTSSNKLNSNKNDIKATYATVNLF